MNHLATVALASVLATGSALGAWRAGVFEPQYAEVLRSTPVTVGDRVVGYEVAWRWRDRSGVARMDARPGERLPVVDGAIANARTVGP